VGKEVDALVGEVGPQLAHLGHKRAAVRAPTVQLALGHAHQREQRVPRALKAVVLFPLPQRRTPIPCVAVRVYVKGIDAVRARRWRQGRSARQISRLH
jgi:hypothetical protein